MHLLQLLCLGQCFGVQAYLCLNKYFSKTPFSDQTGKGEKGWGIFMQEVLVAERPKQSDMSHSAIIYIHNSTLVTAYCLYNAGYTVYAVAGQ